MLDRPPSRDRAPTRVGAVMASLRSRMDSRALAPGARLPSVRALAAESWRCRNRRSSRLTIGWSRKARSPRGAARVSSSPGRRGPWCSRAQSSGASRWPIGCGRSAAALEADPDVVQPGSGWLPKSWLPELGMQRALRDLARDRAFRKTQYNSPIGHAPLRRQLAVRLSERGVVGLPRTDRARPIRAPTRSTSRCVSSSSRATRSWSTTPAISGCCRCSRRIASTSSG